MLFVIGLVFGGGIGFTIAAGNGITFDGHNHANPAHHGAGHEGHEHSELLEVDGEPPSIRLMLTPDPSSGWNLHLLTEQFLFSPENASREHVPGEGHAHLYVNGAKLARLYGAWHHLDALPEGAEVTVGLYTNDHRAYASDGEKIAATVTVGD